MTPSSTLQPFVPSTARAPVGHRRRLPRDGLQQEALQRLQPGIIAAPAAALSSWPFKRNVHTVQ